jgi:hypothetical protein
MRVWLAWQVGAGVNAAPDTGRLKLSLAGSPQPTTSRHPSAASLAFLIRAP